MHDLIHQAQGPEVVLYELVANLPGRDIVEECWGWVCHLRGLTVFDDSPQTTYFSKELAHLVLITVGVIGCAAYLTEETQLAQLVQFGKTVPGISYLMKDKSPMRSPEQPGSFTNTFQSGDKWRNRGLRRI